MKPKYSVYVRAVLSPQGLVILASAVLAVLAVFGFVFSPADGVILGVLCILSASLVVQRMSQELFHRKIVAIAGNRKTGPDALLCLDDLPPLAKRITGAEEIWVSGLTLSTFLVSYRILLRTFVANGGRLRFLMAPHNGPVVDTAMLYFPMERAVYSNGRNISLDIINELRADHEEAVSVCQLTVFPSHLLLLINPKRSDAEIQVHMNVFGSSPENNPLLVVHREESETSYQLFLSEFERLWQAGIIGVGDNCASNGVHSTPTGS